ncbi:hypothetical protein PVAP13_1KG357305 [Panicum virgatum]|uniref:PhoD-like phosphatase metallophosphatase domain-containing protein n=1 Tax=Panicum virgatum TaxID=38727 RepID=A0A8T0XVU8_PANVG|nr:hypothetical protein PVAP13_1KG357305 [Panicum virgatum]
MAATFRLLILLLIVVVPPFVRAARDADAVVSRIAFGSCANQSAPQPIWDAVVAFDPQVFVWLGDNVYGDNKRPFRVFGKERTVGPWKNVPRFYPSTEQELRRRYQLAKAKPGYASLRERAQVIGTWDDHDYGLNDAGKEFSGKVFTQRLLLDFLDEAEDSKRRKQAGVYTSHMFGPEGKRVKVILLDTRYHRDPLLSDGTILGDPQWQWLERELHGPQSEITVIGSSIQVLSNLSATTGPLFYVESWARFPRERERLFRLIESSKCQPNFGAIEIDWNALPPRIKLELRDVEGRSVHSVEFPISELQPSGALAMKKQEHAFQRHCTLETELPWLTQYWLALLFFGTIAVFIIAVVLLAITCLSSILTCSKKTKKE